MLIPFSAMSYFLHQVATYSSYKTNARGQRNPRVSSFNLHKIILGNLINKPLVKLLFPPPDYHNLITFTMGRFPQVQCFQSEKNLLTITPR